MVEKEPSQKVKSILSDQTKLHPLLDILSSKSICSEGKNTDNLFLESIDEVLADLLGRRVRDAFYDHIERNYYLARDGIPGHLDDFLMILERTFGNSGKTVERSIAKRLCAKLEQHPSA